MTSLTQKATESLGVKPRDAERSKNFFALGLVSWLYSRPTQPTIDWIEGRFKDEFVRISNLTAFIGASVLGTAGLGLAILLGREAPAVADTGVPSGEDPSPED